MQWYRLSQRLRQRFPVRWTRGRWIKNSHHPLRHRLSESFSGSRDSSVALDWLFLHSLSRRVTDSSNGGNLVRPGVTSLDPKFGKEGEMGCSCSRNSKMGSSSGRKISINGVGKQDRFEVLRLIPRNFSETGNSIHLNLCVVGMCKIAAVRIGKRTWMFCRLENCFILGWFRKICVIRKYI